VAYEACANSFPSLHPYKRAAKLLVNTSIILLQIGICAVAFVFMASNLRKVGAAYGVGGSIQLYRDQHLQVFQEEFDINLSKDHWLLIVFIPILITCFMRTLRAIALLSFIGGIFMIVVVGFVLQYLLFAKHIPFRELPWITDFTGVMTACGSALYAFEGQAMVLPLENKLRDPRKMNGMFGVLSTAMGAVALRYLSMGLSGYLTYGSDVAGSGL